jgi:hypothetical protein
MGVKLGLTLREEHRLRVFENRVLRRIYGLKRDEVTGGWRKGTCCACVCYKALVGKPEGKTLEEDLGTDGRIILKQILNKYDGRL